jgi:hypothetical protein
MIKGLSNNEAGGEEAGFGWCGIHQRTLSILRQRNLLNI